MEPYIRYANYHETDQMGVIHHANYVKWLEEARVFYLKQLGIDYATFERENHAVSPVLEIKIEYKGIIRFGDTVEIIVKMINFTGVRMEFEYSIIDSVTKEIKTSAYSKHCFSYTDGRVTSLKKIDQNAYNRILEEYKTVS